MMPTPPPSLPFQEKDRSSTKIEFSKRSTLTKQLTNPLTDRLPLQTKPTTTTEMRLLPLLGTEITSFSHSSIHLYF